MICQLIGMYAYCTGMDPIAIYDRNRPTQYIERPAVGGTPESNKWARDVCNSYRSRGEASNSVYRAMGCANNPY